MNQKGFSPIIFILGIFVISGVILFGAYYLKSKQNPYIQPQPTSSVIPTVAPISSTPTPLVTSQTVDASNWKTYKRKYYTFKYPSHWSNDISDQQYFETGTLIHTSNISFSDFNNFQKGALIYSLFISEERLVDPELKSIDDVFSKSIDPKDMSLVSTLDLTIDGQSAKEKIYKGSSAETIELVFQYPNSIGYGWIIMDSSIQDFDFNQKDFSAILTTFKFTN